MSYQYMWLNLKLDLLPSIAQEVEKITKDYLKLSDDVRKGDTQAFQELVVLQANIRARIEEFDRFYDRNYADYRIGYFEKMKLRLRKLLSPHIDVNRLIYEDSQQFQNRLNQFNQGGQGKSVSPYQEESYQQQQQQVKQKSQSPQQIRQQQEIKQKSPQKFTKDKQQSNVQQNSSNKKPTTAGGKAKGSSGKGVKNQTENTAEKDDLVFTIKMNKEEYLQYLQAKQKKGR